MDRDLAHAVFARWGEGLPVYESTLYKAAEVVGVDPVGALLEARYYTHLDNALTKLAHGQVPSVRELEYIFAAAGGDDMEKTAERYDVHPVSLSLRTLEQRNWEPNLVKLAQMVGMTGSNTGPMDPPPEQFGGVDPSMALPEQMAPQPGTQVQQQPAARYRPTPTAPPQQEPTPDGNLNAILEQARQMEQGGGQPGAPGAEGGPGQEAMAGDMAQPQAQPADPAQKIQSVAPDLDPQLLERYAQSLSELEQKIGIPVMDPKQLTKFVQQMQKADGKVVDQAIKEMASEQTAAPSATGTVPGQ